MSLDRMFEPDYSSESIAEGFFAETAGAYGDLLKVIVPGVSEDQYFGPCSWSPRGELMPVEGDPCVVWLNLSGDSWIIEWGGEGDYTTPLSAAGLNDWEARIKAETDALEVLADRNTAHSVPFEDAFARANGPLAGSTAPTGQTWSVNGTGGASAAIQSQRFVSDGTSYATPGVLDEMPVAFVAEFSYGAGGGVDPFTEAALISSADSSVTLDHLCHLIWSPTAARVTWWKPGDIDNEFAEGTSNITFSTPFATDGTVHKVTMSIVAERVRVEFSNGETMEASDPNLPDCAGPLGVWEILDSSDSAIRTRIESASVVSADIAGVPLPTVPLPPTPFEIHNVGGSGEPAWLNSWAAEADDVPCFYKRDGLVYIEGRITGGVYATDAFVLPAGFRPVYRRRFSAGYPATVVYGGTAFCTYIDVYANGHVYIGQVGGAPLPTVELGAIVFRAA